MPTRSLISGQFGAVARSQLGEDALCLPRETLDGWRDFRRLRVDDRIDRTIGNVTTDGGGVDLLGDGIILRVRETHSSRVHVRADIANETLE